MENRKRTLIDFMMAHPFIFMVIITSICESISSVVHSIINKNSTKDSYIFEPENCKSCGSTEEEE